MLFLIFIFIAFMIIFGILIHSSIASASESANFSYLGKKKLVHYNQSEVTIDEDEVIEADIVIESGEIKIAGEVYGDIIAFESEVKLEADAELYGHLICFNCELDRSEESHIAGDIILLDENSIEVAGGRNLIGYGFQLNQFQSDTIIEEDESVVGDILVLNHELVIKGKVDGDVINILGRTIIKPSAAIDGHTIAFQGQIATSNKALVTGRILGLEKENETVEVDTDRERDERIRNKVERKYLKRDHETGSDIFRFWGDITIEPDEIIKGAVVTVRGTIEIKGEVDGDVVAVFGSVELDSSAYVYGDIVSVGGKIYRENGAIVEGDLIQTSITGVKINNEDSYISDDDDHSEISFRSKRESKWERRRKKVRHRWDTGWNEESFMFRYNRVEGLFLGLKLNKNDWNYKNDAFFDLFGHIGYGFANKSACYQIGVQRSIFGNFGPVIGIETHDVTTTQDTWMMPQFENSLAAFLIKEDFHDYYRMQGYSAYATLFISEYLKLGGEYHVEDYFDLHKSTNWSIFGGDKNFRLNPLIQEMDYKSVIAKISFDTRDSYKYPDKGWWFNAEAEFAGEKFNDNGIDFDRYIIDLRRYQPVSYGENLDFRVRVGSSRGSLPRQLQFDAGGFSALRGYEFKEFKNFNRMVLGSLEYRIYGRRNPLNNIFGMSDFNLILFADAGYLWSANDSLNANEGFDSKDWEDLKTSLGFAISNDEGNIRLNFAKRFDEKDKPFVVTFRISRPF